MPWKEVLEMDQKKSFVQESLKPGVNFSELCERFGITRPTGYKWVARYKEEGEKGLKHRSHSRKNVTNRTPLEMENLILQVRDLKPDWGGVKIRHYLISIGYHDLPSSKTMNNILKRSGRICVDESKKHQAWIRFEHEHPNDLWQMDFKGHFALMNETRCHPLTLLDDHSRFSLLIRACTNEKKETVKEALIDVFRQYGMPIKMTMDNGSPWGCNAFQQHTALTAWLMRLGIKVLHSRPRHPQTQGKLERFHRTFKLELLSRYHFSNVRNAQGAFDSWRDEYNFERPHAAIEHKRPFERYQPSQRVYPEVLPPVEYEESMTVRKVQKTGEIYLKGKEYYVSKAFGGQQVGLKPSEEEGMMDVYFCQQKVLKLDLLHGDR